jgi:hypothetical protein
LAAKPAVGSSSGMNIGFGVDSGPSISGINLNAASIKFVTETMSSSVGLAFTSQSGTNANVTAFGLLGKSVFNLTGGQFPTHAGASIAYYSNPLQTANSSAFQIAAVYGVDTTLAGRWNIGVDIYPLAFTSMTANNVTITQFSLINAAVHCYYMF